jgi:FHS family L-fucose permease-like MFS transporter
MLIKNPARQLDTGYLDRTPLFQFVLLSLLFPMWGAAAGLNDILITQFKHVFTLSDVATAFVQSAFYGGYFLIAIPASRIVQLYFRSNLRHHVADDAPEPAMQASGASTAHESRG